MTSVYPDVGSLGSTDNVRTIFDDVLWSMSAAIAEIAFRIRVFRSSSSEHIAVDITPQEKIQWCYVW
jgi:hypothetical protein